MRQLIFGMNVSLDGYVAGPGDDLGWGVPSDELFQLWSDRVGVGSHWPTADQQPDATPATIEFARR